MCACAQLVFQVGFAKISLKYENWEKAHSIQGQKTNLKVVDSAMLIIQTGDKHSVVFSVIQKKSFTFFQKKTMVFGEVHSCSRLVAKICYLKVFVCRHIGGRTSNFQL